MDSLIKVRFRYSKTGMGVYLGHLEVSKMFDRAFKRSGIKLRYSEGFNPQPKMSFAAPISVGFSSEYEMGEAELELEEDIPKFEDLLLPRGFEILQYRRIGRDKSLMARTNSCDYIITPSGCFDEFDPDRILDFAEQDYFPFEKIRRGKKYTYNLMDYINLLEPADGSVKVNLEAGSAGALNPRILANILFKEDCQIHRTAIYDINSKLLIE